MVRYLVVFGLLLQAGQILADTVEGRVVGVSDGDTITSSTPNASGAEFTSPHDTPSPTTVRAQDVQEAPVRLGI